MDKNNHRNFCESRRYVMSPACDAFIPAFAIKPSTTSVTDYFHVLFVTDPHEYCPAHRISFTDHTKRQTQTRIPGVTSNLL